MKRGPRIIVEDLVVRSYEYGEVRGSITLTKSTPLEEVATTILKRFHQDPLYFQTELKNGVYVVSERVNVASGNVYNTFSEWRQAMMQQYPSHFFSPLNSVESIPPMILNPIIVPNTIYSPRCDNGKFYYALPNDWNHLCSSGCAYNKLMERAQIILNGFDEIENVSTYGAHTNGDMCAFSPASFIYKSRPTFSESTESVISPDPPTADAEFVKVAGRIMTYVDEKTDYRPILDIVSKYHRMSDDTLDLLILSRETLDKIEAHFVKERIALMQNVQSKLGKRKLNALIKEHGAFESISCAVFRKIEALLTAKVPKKPIAPSPPSPPPQLTFEEMKERALVIKDNHTNALGACQDELKRLCGKVVMRDHKVAPIEDPGAPYRMPTKESILAEIESSDSSSY